MTTSNAKITAFIARGFLPADNEVWLPFADHLNRFRAATGWFDWAEGAPAESKEVGAKVRALIDSNQVFIAIVTKRKLLVEPNLKALAGLSLDLIKGNPLPWSTSNWVIQESGYAIARDRKIILLIEDGVREFPSLHDNLEYIQFTRDDIAGAFIKLQEMLNNLHASMSAPASLVEAPSEAVPPPTKPPEQSTPALPKELENSERFFAFVDQKNFKEAEKLLPAIEAAAEKPRQKESARSYLLLKKLQAGNARALDELKEMSKTAVSALPDLHLGYYYREFKHPENAIAAFKRAATKADDLSSKVALTKQVAEQLSKLKRFTEALSVLSEFFQSELPDSVRASLFEAIGEVFDSAGKKQLMACAYEQSLALIPTNNELRFKLAHHYGGEKKHRLALFHYRLYLEVEEGGGTLNNLGLVYDSLKLKQRSIASLRRAAELGEGLAMSNIANRYLDEGFADDAKTQIDRGLKQDKPSPNLGFTLSRLNDTVEDERKSEESLIAEADEESKFASAAAGAVTNSAYTMGKTWSTRFGDVPIKIELDNSFSGTITTKMPGSSLARILNPAGKEYHELQTVEISGQKLGNALEFECRIYEHPAGTQRPTGTILSPAQPKEQFVGYGYLESDVSAKLVEHSAGGTVRYTTLSAIV